MSYLSDHARAFRALGRALRAEGENGTDRPTNSELLCLMADAHMAAAADIEAEVSGGVVDHACTIDHRALTVPRCPACGAPRS